MDLGGAQARRQQNKREKKTLNCLNRLEEAEGGGGYCNKDQMRYETIHQPTINGRMREREKLRNYNGHTHKNTKSTITTTTTYYFFYLK